MALAKLALFPAVLLAVVNANKFRQTLFPLQSDGMSMMWNLDAVANPGCRQDLSVWYNATNKFVDAVQSCSATQMNCTDEQKQAMTDNMFAIQQIDSFGWPTPGLLTLRNKWQGSWEECLSVKADYSTRFCWVAVSPNFALLGGAPSILGSASGCSSPVQIEWSVCMPRSCSSEDVSALVATLNNVTAGMAQFCGARCINPEKPHKSGWFWVVTAYCILIILLMIVSTVIDYVTTTDNHPSFKSFRSSAGARALLAFSLYTNGSEILSVVKRPGQIESISCIRAFSMTWVMVGHMLSSYQTGDNFLSLYNTTKAFLNDAFLNAFVSVDSFLFVGGLLTAYLFYKEMDRNPRSRKSPSYWILFYVHRVLRLSPAYFLFLGFFMVMYEQLTTGPRQVMPENMQTCRTYWWHNILYINNLFSTNKMCMGHTWYLAVDMQIHFLAPLLLVPLLLSKIAGTVVAFLFLAGSVAATYGTYYHYKFAPTVVGLYFTSLDQNTIDHYFMYIYYPPWIRCTPYIIGVLTGYILHKTRNKQLKFHPIIVIALWAAAVALGIACVFGLYGYFKGIYHLSTFGSSSYYAWHRIAWSLSLAWVIFACQHNMAGFVKNFMELGIWGPLGRLTYCAYLTHEMIIDVIDAQSRQSLHYVTVTEAYIHRGLPVFIVSYVFAFFWSCGFELPFGKLERMGTDALLHRGRPSPIPVAVEKPVTIAAIESESGERYNNGNAYRRKAFDDPKLESWNNYADYNRPQNYGAER